MIYFSHITNPFQPNKGRIDNVLDDGKTVWDMVREQKVDLSRPTICMIDGAAVLRKFWNDTVQPKSLVCFITLPQGGGGKKSSNPIQVVLMVAVVVASVYTGGAVGAAYGAVWGGVAAAGVSMAGSFLVNTFVPTPRASLNGSGSANSIAAQSPTYSLQAQGNQARLGSPIPVIYGRHLIYPDFASQPYYGYANDEQYVYQLHCIGQGEYNIEQIRIEDTPINSFEEITYQIINPGEQNTLFRDDVVTSPEVAGQELLKDEVCGPFVLNPTESVIDKIEIDVAFQRGLYYANNNGGMDNKTIQWRIDARLIDDEDLPLGDWFTLGSESFASNNHNSMFRTYSYAVASGRYEVRAVRLDVKDTSSRAGHEIRWASAKGFIVSSPSYGDVTLIAVKMKATNNLSQRSSRMLNCIVTRRLDISSLINGGSQEKGKRAGTENVASIVGMSTALKNNCNKLKENTRHILMLEEVLLRKLKESDLDFICNTNVNHIPGNISLSFKGISGETLMHRLDLKGIMVSTGSACDSAKNQTSHVIKALGVPEDYAYGTIRISLGKENTEDEIEEIFIAINEIVKSLTV